ncbi:unnamed protein product [Amoebophrya sp. A120]|nr:unnamed protein product [Amoebophrya sp. A120]|eukprot:GSA120T00011015001.1
MHSFFAVSKKRRAAFFFSDLVPSIFSRYLLSGCFLNSLLFLLFADLFLSLSLPALASACGATYFFWIRFGTFKFCFLSYDTFLTFRTLQCTISISLVSLSLRNQRATTLHRMSPRAELASTVVARPAES